MKKSIIFILFFTFLLVSFPNSIFATNIPKNEFTAVINQSKSVGIISKDADNISYQANITRLEFIQTLVRAYEIIKGSEITVKNDVKISDSSDLLVKKAVSAGIVSPDSSGKIAPESTISREAVAQMIFNTSKLVATPTEYGSSFDSYFCKDTTELDYYSLKDIESIAAWSKSSVLFCLDRINVLTFDGNRNFSPYEKIKREDAFKVINDITWIYGAEEMLAKGSGLLPPKLEISKYRYNRDNINIDWSDVKGAKKYKVELFNSENTKIFDSESKPNLNISDSAIYIGNYSGYGYETSNQLMYNDFYGTEYTNQTNSGQIEELKLEKLFGTQKKDEKVTIVISAIDNNGKISNANLKFDFIISKFENETEMYFGGPDKTWFGR